MKKFLVILTMLLLSLAASYGDHLSEKMNECGVIEADPPKAGSIEWIKLIARQGS